MDIERYKKLCKRSAELTIEQSEIELELDKGFRDVAYDFYDQLSGQWGQRNVWDGVEFTPTTFVIKTWYGGEQGDDETYPIEVLFLAEPERNQWIIEHVKERKRQKAEAKKRENEEYQKKQTEYRRKEYEALKKKFEGATE